MSIIQIQGGIPRAAAVVDGRATPPVYKSNSGQFTTDGISRIAAGVYHLTLSQPINVDRCDVLVTHVIHPAAGVPPGPPTFIGSCAYRIVSTTVIEVIVGDPTGYGNFDAEFSIRVVQVA